MADDIVDMLEEMPANVVKGILAIASVLSHIAALPYISSSPLYQLLPIYQFFPIYAKTLLYGWEVEIGTDYNGIGKILYLLGNAGIEPLESNYTDAVRLRALVPADAVDKFQ